MLRSLTNSLMKLSASSAVAPLPATTSFGHQLTSQLNTIQSQTDSQNANGLLHALVDAATTTQQITLNSLSDFTTTTCQPSDRKIIDDYLDFNVKMLDTCNELTEKIDTIRNYVESLKVVSRLLESGQPHPTTLARAKHLLDSCHNATETKRPFKRFFSQKLDQSSSSDSKLAEILGGSKAVTSMVCEILGTALSFKSKQRLSLLPQSTRSSSWSCSLQQLQKQIKEHQKSGSSMMLTELHQTVKAAHYLRNQIKGRNTTSDDVEELKRRCEELEKEIKPFQGKECIMEQWEKNYYISAIAGANNGSSLVVMSKAKRQEALLEEWPGTNNFTIAALMSVKWKEPSEEEKQAWNAKAAEAMEAYKKELEEYKNSIAAAIDDNQQLQKELVEEEEEHTTNNTIAGAKDA
ncbi:hypothetical protein EZV62_014768 [Acer yangbiense]|uniref:HMG box domain-containing protein n=1 Tax=Acer yangbiense TaxID=1000413 RepID=A0A5C7HTN9_9ROSI|nr:hypothetical protein EZV62_014768 [Acer yangbiense]